MSEDRIAHILSEASSLMKQGGVVPHREQERRSHGGEDSHSNEDSKSPPQSCTSPFFKVEQQLKQHQHLNPDQAAAAQQREREREQREREQQQRLRHEDLAQDKMARLYQELIARTPRETAFPRWVYKRLWYKCKNARRKVLEIKTKVLLNLFLEVKRRL